MTDNADWMKIWIQRKVIQVKTRWDHVKEDMNSLGLSQEDSEPRNKW